MSQSDGSDQVPSKLPYATFRDIVKLELSGNANRDHQELVRRPENTVRWLRVLMTIWRSIERQNAAAKAYLSAHRDKNAAGRSDREYLKARRAYEVDRGRREWVMSQLTDRVAEAKDIIIEQDAISAKALEQLATSLLHCDRTLAVGKVPEARAVLRRIMDSVGSISTMAEPDDLDNG